MMINDIVIGKRVKSIGELCGVPAGTEGVIIDDYVSGFTVAWDMPSKPFSVDMTPEEVAKMYAINPDCPLRDGFNKATEMHMLEAV